MDLSSGTAIARMLLPNVPHLFGSTLYHTLGLSPTSSKWDLRTELIAHLIRRLMENERPKPLLKQQIGSARDPGIKGKMWISKVTLPAPEETDVLDLLCNSIENMRETGHEIFKRPLIEPVEAEWNGFRANVGNKAPRPDLPEDVQYKRLMAEVDSDVTILYMHGGALIFMDPATHRLPCSHLARRTKGRCFSIRYRLAPQNAFPSALLDVLIAYIALLYPPPNAYHEAVKPENVIFAGDSAGGTLSFALLQLLLQINRDASEFTVKSLRFHDQEIPLPLPLPAGIAAISPWLDITCSLPSYVDNYETDYLPTVIPKGQYVRFPRDDIWPADPPRGDLYCDTSVLLHPLVSPLAAKSWQSPAGCCPMLFICGEEMLADENKSVARKAASQGVPVVWQQWEAQPHCWSMFFMDSPMSKASFANWATFCSAVVAGGREAIQTKGSWFQNRTIKESDVDVLNLPVCNDDEVKSRMEASQRKRALGFETETKAMPKL